MEFMDENNVLFAAANTETMFNFLKTFKDDLLFKVQKAVKIRYIKP